MIVIIKNIFVFLIMQHQQSILGLPLRLVNAAFFYTRGDMRLSIGEADHWTR